MASKGQFTGMTGSFLVAAQLSARHLVASTTSRSAAGADILVTDSDCRVSYSVQVKTNSKSTSFWLLGQKEPSAGSSTHLYAFVNLGKDQSGDVTGDYYIVPSHVVRKIAKFGGASFPTYSVYRTDIEKYRNKWDLFGGR